MPENAQDKQAAVEASDTIPLSPEWGGVPRSGGDAADATGGGPPEPVDVTPEPADADGDAGEEAEADAESETVAVAAGEDAPAGSDDQ
jgi:hypothetical protein